MTAADAKARLTAPWEAADAAAMLEREVDAPVPPGWSMWRPGTSVTTLPELRPLAPWRCWCTTWRACWPRCLGAAACGQVADPTSRHSRPEGRTPASWALVPPHTGTAHEPDCPALFGQEDGAWFDARAVRRPDPEKS